MVEPETRTEKYILRLKEGRGNTEEVIEKVRRSKVDDLENTRIELEIEKMKTEIKKLQEEGQPVQPQQSMGLVSAIIAQNLGTPERAQAFLSGLDEENVNKLAFLLSSDNPRAEALTNMMRSPTSSIKDLVEVVKLVTTNKNEGTSMKDMAEVFKVAFDYAKANQPPPQNPQAGFEYIYDKFLKPIQETMNTTNQALLEAKIEAVKAQMPAPLETQIANIKAIAGQIGLGNSGGKSDLDLKIEDMRQRHDIDMESIRWEKEKFLLGKESDTEKWDKIAGMFSPIFAMPEMRNAITKIGESVGKGIGGATNPSTPTQPQIVNFVCPSCSAELSVPLPPNAPEEVPIKCPKCGTITPAKLSQPPPSQTPPPEQKSTSTRLKAAYT